MMGMDGQSDGYLFKALKLTVMKAIISRYYFPNIHPLVHPINIDKHINCIILMSLKYMPVGL